MITLTAPKKDSWTLAIPAPKLRAYQPCQRGGAFKNKKAYDRKVSKSVLRFPTCQERQ